MGMNGATAKFIAILYRQLGDRSLGRGIGDNRVLAPEQARGSLASVREAVVRDVDDARTQ